MSGSRPKGTIRTLALVAGVVGVLGAVGWLAFRADRLMRASLLQEARMIARAVNMDRVAALTWTEADLTSPDYLRIKAQLTRVRDANPRCRFLYLMGREPDGGILILVDSESPESADYSPPGQTYDEASAEVRALFVDVGERVQGPFSDRWGTWISAFVPLTDPATGELRAIFGMDIEASDWWRMVASRAVLPVTLTVLVFLLGLLVSTFVFSNRAIRQMDRDRELLLRRMINAFAVFESVFDKGGRFVSYRFLYINEAYERVTGVRHEQVIGRTVHEVWPGTEPGWVEAYGKVAVTGVPGEFDMYHAPTGKLYHCNVYRPGYGRDRFCVIFEDITERRRAEEGAREALARFETVIQSTPLVAIEGYDGEGTVKHWNTAAEQMYGFSAREAVGKKIQDLLQEDPETGCQAVIAEVWRTGQATRPQEWAIKTKAGKVRWVYSSLFPVFEGGRVIEVFCMDVDVTERRNAEDQVRGLLRDSDRARTALLGMLEDVRKAEDEVRRANEDLELRVRERTRDLESANKELEAFSYSVSHDLRGPLRSIDGFSQSVLEDYGEVLGGEGRSELERVRSAAQKMSMLIDDLLVLSRLSRREMNKERVDLSRMARTIGDELPQHEPGRCVDIRVEEGIEAECDPQLIRAALQNLLNNAWKFTAKREKAQIEFGVTEKDDLRVFYVKDNGAGFDMKYVDKLFGPFQRLHTDEEFPGTGIGLATVQRIIHRHGGRVWAEGEVGKGATFYFTLA